MHWLPRKVFHVWEEHPALEYALQDSLWMQDLPCDRLRLVEILGTSQLFFQQIVVSRNFDRQTRAGVTKIPHGEVGWNEG